MPEPNDLTFARLLDWLEGRLSEEETEMINQQIATADAETQATVAWLRAFLEMSASTILVSPPPEVHQKLLDQFATYAQHRRPPSLFQQLVAALSFDSGAQLSTAGIRAVGAHAQRQLLYATTLADIALNIQPETDDHFSVFGQVFTSQNIPLEGLTVQILQDAQERGLTTTDELGEFIFQNLPPGEYEIVLTGDQFEIILTPVLLQVS